MKKFTVLFLAGFLILAFGTTVYAQAKLEFKASGFIDIQSFWLRNVPQLQAPNQVFYGTAPFGPSTGGFVAFDPVTGRRAGGLNKSDAYWDTRFSLRFDAVMGKELSGTLQFEMDASRWGNAAGAAGSASGAMGRWSADSTAVEIKYAYVDFGMPYFGIPVPMTVRAGVQPFAIRPWFLQAADGAGVSGGINIDPVMINPMYFKVAEGVDWIHDDVDAYALQASAKLGTFNVGGYWLFYDMENYPVGAAAAPYVRGPNDADFHWFGLFLDGKAGPVNLQFDAGYDWGKVKNPTFSDVKYRGWATRLKVNFPWEKFDAGFVGMYATGADANKSSQAGLPDGTSTKMTGWVVPVGSEQAPACGAIQAESVVFYGQDPGASGGAGWAVRINGSAVGPGSYSGTWFGKLYASYKATPWYKVTLQGLYIGDTVKHANAIGTARKSDGTFRDDKTIGIEFDLINDFQIYKNLSFKLSGGYLFAGKGMDLYTGVPAVGNFEMQNPWAIRTKLFYAF